LETYDVAFHVNWSLKMYVFGITILSRIVKRQVGFFLPKGIIVLKHFISLSFHKYLLTIVFTIDILVAVN